MATPAIIEAPAPPPPSVAPVLPTPRPIPTDPRKEYIAGGGGGAGINGPRVLPFYTDDVMRDFGLDIYERMAHDPQVHKGEQVFVKSILSAALTVQPPHLLDPKSPRYPLAQRISAFSQENLNRLPTPFLTILDEMVTGALRQGHKIAERIYQDGVQYDKKARSTQTVLRDLKPRPLTAYAWGVDPYNNVLGLLAQEPGKPLWNNGMGLSVLPAGTAGSPLIAYDKVWHLVWGPQNGDPRGTSHYRHIYGPWWGKQEALRNIPLYVRRWGQPSYDGELAPNAGDLPGTTPTDPITAMEDAIKKMMGGGYIVRPSGSKLTMLEAKGDGAALYHAISLYNTEIIGGLTYQQLATDQGEHASRAQASTQQDVMELLFLFGKRWVSAAVRKLLRPLVLINYGPANLDLLPDVALGETEPHDLPEIMQAIAQLDAKNDIPWITPKQRPWWDARMGVPPRADGDDVAPPVPTPVTTEAPTP